MKSLLSLKESEMLINDLSNFENNKDIKLKSVLMKFMCYFNLFESYLHENNIQHWDKFFEGYTIDESLINEHFNFFYNRYVVNNKVNSKFNKLCQSVKKKYKNRLENNLIGDQNKAASMLSISYYFRNNLYHGHKCLQELKVYEECFENIVVFVSKVLENAKAKSNGKTLIKY